MAKDDNIVRDIQSDSGADCKQTINPSNVKAKSDADDKDINHVHRHFKMYKPPKVLTQFVFHHRKRKQRNLLGDSASIDFPPGTMAIGRLDEDSEGLLLLTTDGKLSEFVRRKCVEKEYWVQVDGKINEEAISKIQKGVEIKLPGQEESYRTLPCKARTLETAIVECKISTSTTTNTNKPELGQTKKRKKFKGTCNRCGLSGHKSLDCPTNDQLPKDEPSSANATITMALPVGISPPKRTIRDESRHGPSSWLSVTITEGKNRQVRRMTAAVGFPTLRLVRVRIGAISLAEMTIGEVKELDENDISSFT